MQTNWWDASHSSSSQYPSLATIAQSFPLFGPSSFLSPSVKNVFVVLSFYYRSQRSCGKVMFLHVSVILGRHPPWQADTPHQADTSPDRADTFPLADRHPPGRHLPWQADTSPLAGRHPRDGHCRGRYASYWNAFLL